MRKRKHLTKILGAITVICLAMAAYLITVYAAPSNTRGRIAIDLGTFQEQGVGGSGSHDLEKDKYGYCLWYRNRFFSDRHYDGVTYRSKQAYDMTDVKALEFFAFAQTDEHHKFMVYCTSGDNITYQSKHIDDVKDSMYGNNPKVDGKVYTVASFSTQYNLIQWSHDYRQKSINVTDSYENRYIYVGLSHGIVEQKVQVHFGNSTYNQEKKEGSIALILKEHKITLLYPEDKQQRIAECTEKDWSKSNNETEYQAYINLSLKLNDGKTYVPNQTGSVYRDEKIVFACEYTGEAPSVRLTGYKIYADEDRKTLLYTLTSTELNEVDDVKTSTGTIQASNTINFNSQLIQKIEKASGKDLGDFYIEPVFEPIKVSFSHADVATNQNNVKIGKQISDTYGYKYPVYEVDDKGCEHILGYIRQNKANRIGDYLWLDYEADPNSDSQYAVSRIYVKHADSEANVPTTSDNSVGLSTINPDYVEGLFKQHVWISVNVKCKPTLKLEDKTVTFNNHTVEIDPASVEYDLSIGKVPKHLKDIQYVYYADEKLTKQLTEPPTEAGTYYVKATMAGDDDYVNSESNVAKLTIEKAVPKVKSAKGTTITYGEALEKSTLTGTVVGVTGNTITGTLEWADKDRCPDAGVQREAVKFTPDTNFAKNYTTYEETYEDEGTTKSGVVTVKAATAVLACTDETVVYDGEKHTYQGVKAYLKGEEQIPENEITVPLNYTYYSDDSYSSESKLEQAPTDVGTYYVKVSIPSECNYNKTSAKGTLTITQAQANLIHVPMGETYDIYLRGIFTELPNGKIQLEVTLGEASKTYQADIQRKEGRVCAVFDTAEIMPEAAEEYTITASYIPDRTKVQNYSISENTWTYKKGEATKSINLHLKYGDRNTYSYESDWNRDFFDSQYPSEDNIQITWLWDENTDVIRVTDSTDGSLNKKFEAQNAGEAHVLGYVKEELTTEETGETKYQSYYVMYNITVDKMTPTVELNGATTQVETFDGTVKLYKGTATVKGKKFGKIDWSNPTSPWEDEDITDKATITYRYFHGANLMIQEYPVEVGTYTIEARSAEMRNYYQAYSAQRNHLVIQPAKPSIDMDNLMATYDGKSKTIVAKVEPTVSKKTQNDEEADVDTENVEWWPVTGDVSYIYQKIGEDTKTETAPKDVGIYYVTATVSKKGNYAEASTKALLSINPARMSIEAKDKTVVYNGKKVSVNIVCTVNGQTVATPNSIEYQYLRSGDSEDMATTEPPTDAGVYYVKAILNDDNYISTESNTAVLTIQKAQPTVTIPSMYQKTYDGKAAVADSAVVKVDNVDRTDQFEVKYSYYEDEACKNAALTPENAGTYYAKAFVKEQINYKAAESNVQTVVIEKAQPIVTLPEPIVVPYIEAPISLREAVVMVNGEDMTDDFVARYTFYADAAGTTEIDPPTDLGTYYVRAFVDERTNYKAAESNIQSVTIEEIEVTVVIPETISKTYDGTPLLVEKVLVFVNENDETENFDVNYVYYSDEACTQELAEVPKDVSVYYAKAFIEPTGYFKAAQSNVAKLTIEKAQPTVTIPEVIKKTYDGTPISVNSAKVKVDETDMTDAFNVTYTYYSDEACTQKLDEAPIEAGTYWVKAFVEEQTNYKAAESLAQKIIIEQESESESETESGGNGGNESETESGGNGGNESETESGGNGGNESETESGGNGGNETEPGGNGGNESETESGGNGGNESETESGGNGGNETEPGGNGGDETKPSGNGGNETEPSGNGGDETKPSGNGGNETEPGGNGGNETKPSGNDGSGSNDGGTGGSGSNNSGTGSSDGSSVKTGDTMMIQVAFIAALLSLAVSVITGRRCKNEK